MANESENSYTPQTPVMPPPNTEPKSSSPAPRARRVKPMVEGINAPVRQPAPAVPPAEPVEPTVMGGMPAGVSSVVPPKVTLTDPEMELIEETSSQPAASPFIKPGDFGMPQKIELPSQKRKFPWRRLIWALLISLLAVSVVLGALFWYNSRNGEGQSQYLGLFPKRAEVGNQTPQKPVNNPAPQPAPAANPTPASTSPVATATAPSLPAAPIKQIKVTATPTGYLNVRNGPSLGGAILAKVHPGDVYAYTEVKAGWYHIALRDNSTGWVIGQYVEVLK
jgi:Bacterial SH3 domain